MTPEQFCYWLKGRAELRAEPISEEEWESIKAHLDLVFSKLTPLGPGEHAPVRPQFIPIPRDRHPWPEWPTWAPVPGTPPGVWPNDNGLPTLIC